MTKRPQGSQWIKDALFDKAGFERQFEKYVGKEWLDEHRKTPAEAVRRNEFNNLINFCLKQKEYQ